MLKILLAYTHTQIVCVCVAPVSFIGLLTKAVQTKIIIALHIMYGIVLHIGLIGAVKSIDL